MTGRAPEIEDGPHGVEADIRGDGRRPSGLRPIDVAARVHPSVDQTALRLTGQIVGGRFQLLSILGLGGMGVVYEAINVITRKRAAVKLILSSAETARQMGMRFEREARATAALDSEHIVQIFDSGLDEATQHPYIAMELLAGETLSSLSERLGPLPEDVALRLAAHVLLGLATAHEAGVIHRDVKPANIFIVHTDAGDCIAKVIDFGIAKILVSEATPGESGSITDGMFLGSPRYTAPEQIIDERGVDPRADIWSVGAVLAQLLTGQKPHAGLNSITEILLAVCEDEAPDVRTLAPWTSPSAAAVVGKALRRKPDDRFASAREMLASIRAIVGDSLGLGAMHLVPLSAAPQAMSDVSPTSPYMRSACPGPASGLAQSTEEDTVPIRREVRALRAYRPVTDGPPASEARIRRVPKVP
jgi:serine/threonine protein kinase